MEYLEKGDILLINRKTVKRHGGKYVPPKNLLNENPLDYLIDIVNAEMFGHPLYPEINDKAGLYLYNIVHGHIFQDGNKRTGLEAALLFLRINGHRLNKSLNILEVDDRIIPSRGIRSIEILINFTLEVAEGKISLKECQNWFKINCIKIDQK